MLQRGQVRGGRDESEGLVERGVDGCEGGGGVGSGNRKRCGQACQVEGLRSAEHREASRVDGRVGHVGTVVDKRRVDLVADDRDSVQRCELGELLELCARVRDAGGIVRVGDDHRRPGAGCCERTLDHLEIEASFGAERRIRGDSSRVLDEAVERRVHGRRDDDGCARLGQDPQQFDDRRQHAAVGTCA